MSTRALEVRIANPPLIGTDLAALKSTLAGLVPTEIGFDQDIELDLATPKEVRLATWKSDHHGMIEGALTLNDPHTGRNVISFVHLTRPSIAIASIVEMTDGQIPKYALHAQIDFITDSTN